MVKDRLCAVSAGSSNSEWDQWADSLGEREIDFLLAEAQRDRTSDQQNFSALDSRVVAIVGWAIVGVGTLLIAGNLDFDLSARGVSALFVILGASIAVAAGVYTLWPRDWASGSDWDWYRRWEVPEITTMKARSLSAIVQGQELNASVLRRRTRAFQVAAIGLVIEFAALVSTLTLAPA